MNIGIKIVEIGQRNLVLYLKTAKANKLLLWYNIQSITPYGNTPYGNITPYGNGF